MILPSLPKTWKWISLGELSTLIQYGLNEKADEMGTGPVYLRISDIDDFGKIVSGHRKRLLSNTIDFDRYKLLPGDIVIARSGSIGRSYLITENEKNWIFASYLIRFRINTRLIFPEYLAFCLRSTLFDHHVFKFGRSVAQTNINSKELSLFRVPLPTLIEQEKIVSILEQADKLSRLRDETLTMAQKLYQTLFLEMFGDPLSNPKCFPKIQLDILGTIDRGISKHRPRDASFLFGGRYPFIQTGNVANSGGWINNYSQTYSEEGLAQSRLWPEGTLCITIAANIAKTGILTFDACFPDSVVGFLPNQGITTEYIMFALNLFQQRLEANAPQAAQKNINLQILRSLKIPKPPFDIQKKFSHIVKNNYKNILKIKKLSEDLVELFQQIQSEAFCGELTSIWREQNKLLLEKGAKKRDAALGISKKKVTIKEHIPEERPWLSQPNRRWLMEQLSNFQRSVYYALIKWEDTLIPSEDLEDFREQAFPVEHLEDANDQILRALHQLAVLGLIAKISLYNHEGAYVTAFRGLRLEEFSQVSDKQYLAKG